MELQENMANLWQQAEVNSGALHEVTKMVGALRDRPITAPSDKASPATPARPGLLGVLDIQANDIRDIRDVLSGLLDYVGERGVAPVPASTGGYALSPETAKRAW